MSARDTSSERPEVGDVEGLLDVMGDADMLWIYRKDGDRFTYLERRPKEAFTELGIAEATRQRTGGGDYKASIRQPNGQWRESRRFAIAGDHLPVPKTESPSTASAVGSAAPVAASGLGDLPPWVKQLVLPILTAVGAGIAAKLFEKPTADPILLELIRRSGKGESIDPIELQRMLNETEKRGEDRGRLIGELSAKAHRIPVVRDGSGVVDAIREAAPVVKDLITAANQRRARRTLPSSPAAAADAATPAMPATAQRPTDIVPAWLRPYVGYKSLLIDAADNGTDAPAIAEIVLKRADDKTFAAMIEAERAGCLESDLYAAMPELGATEERRAFVTELLEDIRRDLVANMTDDGSEVSEAGDELEPMHAAPPATVHAPAAAAEKPKKAAKAKRAAQS